MIECTFQLAPGIGAYRERQLWSAGITHWDGYPSPPVVTLSQRLDERIRAAVVQAREALRDRDADRLARMLPLRERWRLYGAFEQDAAFVDVERDGESITLVGLLDRDGPRVFVRGRDLDEVPAALGRARLLVTYNGHAFDVPALERAFPGWRAPHAHVDLRHLWIRLGHQGGLKLLEHTTGVGRPEHVARITGRATVDLWRAAQEGDRDALRRLAEYNLYDTVNLRALMALGYNRMIERHRLPAPPVAAWSRGDVLYDLSKQLLAL